MGSGVFSVGPKKHIVSKPTILLIGRGSWGQRYARTLLDQPIRLEITGKNWEKALEEKAPDGVIIATPPETHVEIARVALSLNIPVLIEKPIALTMVDLEKLSGYSVPILVNYSMLFTKTFEQLQFFRGIHSIDVSLYNRGPIRSYSGLWDYGSHAIAFIQVIKKEYPHRIKIEEYPDDQGSLYRIELSYSNDKAVCVVGNAGLEKCNKYQVQCGGFSISYDDLLRPSDHTPPLTNVISVFLKIIAGEQDQRTGLSLSREVTSILETCEQLIK